MQPGARSTESINNQQTRYHELATNRNRSKRNSSFVHSERSTYALDATSTEAMTTQELINQLKQADPSGNALVWLSIDTDYSGMLGAAKSVTVKPVAGPSYFGEITISNQPPEQT